MRVPDGAGDPGRSDAPGDVPFWPGAAREGWRGWAGDVAVVVRGGWRAIAVILLVTTVLPVLPLSLLIADAATLGAVLGHGRVQLGLLAVAVLGVPVLLALATGCGLVVARGWTGAVWAAASARAGTPAGTRDALRWSGRRSRMLWGSYLTGVAVLAAAALLAGYLAPGASTVRDLLVLAGPAGLLAPVLSFAPAAAWRGGAPGAGEPSAADFARAVTGRGPCLALMAFVLAVVVSGEVATALVLSQLMTSAHVSGPAAALIASLIALPGSVLLASASSVSYARCGGKSRH